MGIIINGQNDTIGPVDNTMSLLGTVSIGGTMTIEDFTNIDSVGLITARNGLQVTGGNVGINKASPSRYLEIGGTSNNPQIRLSNGSGTSSLEVLGNAASGQEIRFGTEASPQAGRIIYHNNDNSLSYSNTGGEKVRIKSDGKIGINETSPDSLLHLTNNAAAGIRAGLRLESSGTNNSANDTMGEILFAHNDSNDAGVSASIVCKAEDAAGNTYLQFNNGKPSALVEHLRIRSDGKLSITGSTANMEYLRMGGNNDRGLRFSSSSGSSSVGVVHTINAPGDSGVQGEIVLQTNSTERLRITSAGKVGINTDNPKQKLSVVGRVNIDNQGDYYGAWIDGDSSGSSSFNVGVWHNAGGRMRNEGSHLVLETQNTSHNLQLQPSGGNISVGSNNPNGLLALTANSGRILSLRNSTTGSASGDGSYLALNGSDFQIANAEAANLSLYTADTERMRIDSTGSLFAGGSIVTVEDMHWGHDVYQRPHIFSGQSGGNPADGCLVVSSAETNPGATRIGSLVFGCKTSSATGAVNSGLKAYIDCHTNTNVSDAWKTGAFINFATRADNGGLAERLRITSSGALNVANPSNTVAAGLLNVPNGSRVTTSSGAYVTGNGGVVDMARYEMISRCITAFPNYNTAICAINGAPLYIGDNRNTWASYSALPNYLLGTLTHDCINNTSFTITLACTMTVFMGRSNGWNTVPLSGWNLIESGTGIDPFSSDTRLYVRTLGAGTHNLDNDSAMYFFSL